MIVGAMDELALVLGTQHPYTLAAGMVYGVLLPDLGDLDMAAEVEAHGPSMEVTLGASHPDTLRCRANLLFRGSSAGSRPRRPSVKGSSRNWRRSSVSTTRTSQRCEENAGWCARLTRSPSELVLPFARPGFPGGSPRRRNEPCPRIFNVTLIFRNVTGEPVGMRDGREHVIGPMPEKPAP